MKTRKAVTAWLLTALCITAYTAAEVPAGGLFTDLKTTGPETSKEPAVSPAPEDTEDQAESRSMRLIKTEVIPEGEWQKEAAFSDRLGRIDDTLAMNNAFREEKKR